MSENNYFQFSNSVIVVPLLVTLCIWIVFFIEIHFGINWNQYGIYPRTFTGLRGIIFSPFIHGSAQHLYNNTVPLFVLTTAICYFYKNIAFKIVFFGILISGFLTWCIGRESYHIGASGLIYVLASFVFFKGIFTKYYRLVALSLLVVFVYGSMLWYIFPVKDDISWEGHLSGFVVGLLFAYFLKTPVLVVKKYDWQREDYNEDEDEFLRHFDEQGNFIENTPEINSEQNSDIIITYEYKENKNTKSE